jgi:hypothetical protein
LGLLFVFYKKERKGSAAHVEWETKGFRIGIRGVKNSRSHQAEKKWDDLDKYFNNLHAY